MGKQKRFWAVILTLVMVFSIISFGERKVNADTSFAINLTATKTAAATAKISWNAVPGATGYDVQFHRDGKDWQNDPEYSSGTSYYSTDMLNLVYYFRVRARFSGSTSDWV